MPLLYPRYLYGGVEHQCAEYRHERREEARMRMMAFRYEVGRADVEEETREEREHERERLLGKRDEECRRGAKHRSESIGDEPEARMGMLAAMPQHEVHGVKAVGEIMHQHGDRDYRADSSRDLEREAYREAVEEAVDA